MTTEPIRRLAAGLTALALALALSPPAAALDTAARSALVVDAETGARLLEKNIEEPLPPASMSKLMTLYMVFEALASGRLSLDDRFRVSEKAWKMGGSKMFLREGERVRIADLIRGVIVQSGNDACVVLAEGLSGSEEAFAQAMTERARELGMDDSSFANSTGWPHPGQRMSAEDLVFIAGLIQREFPQFYPYFAETEFSWDGVAQKNRNPLLYMDIGADGLKTGHTEEAGYGLVGSARRGDRRINFILTGLPSAKARSVEAERMVNWAFRQFRNVELYTGDQKLGEVEVWIGEKSRVGLVARENVLVTLPYGEKNPPRARIRYEGPVEAPIEEGARLAELVITQEEMSPIVVPLYAAETIPRGGYLSRLGAAARLLAGRVLEREDAAEDSTAAD